MKPASRKLFSLCLLAILFVGTPATGQTLELVESYPAETDFDQPDIRNTDEVWLEMLDRAQNKIRWATFYISHEPGKATGSILNALLEAAARGVKIHILTDAKFAEIYPETLAELSEKDNIVVRFSPVNSWLGGVMHAKMLLVDTGDGFLGSQNFDWRSLRHIRELGIRFRDRGLVDFYSRAFDWEWQHFDSPSAPRELPHLPLVSREISGHKVFPTVSPGELNIRQEFSDEAQLLRLLGLARDTIEIALLSYSPTTHDEKTFYPVLDNAIRSAATRGVKIRMIVGHWAEQKGSIQHLLSLEALENVEVRACRIPPGSEGEIDFARVHHSKYMVVDDCAAWIGTSNWDQGYFHESRNYGIVLEGRSIPSRLRSLFDFDWARSTSVAKASSPRP